MEVLLYDPDLAWMEQLSEQLRRHGILVTAVQELEELWHMPEETSGLLVNIQELKSMLFWGEAAREEAPVGASYASAIRSLCLQGKKVVLILPELDYEAEYTGLHAGAAECIHKGQPMELIVQRMILTFQKELRQQSVWFGGVQLDCLSCRLIFREHMVPVTDMEQKVLEILFAHGNDLVEKRDILLPLWGEQTRRHRQCLDTLIRKLRHKLDRFPIGIYTRYGKGYYLESEVQPPEIP